MAKLSTYPPDASLDGTEKGAFSQASETYGITTSQLAQYAFTGWGAANAATARSAIGAGAVASVDLGASTGLTPSGGPVTGTGTLTYTLSANLQAWHATSPTTYAGSSTIATLGTVTTGTWNGTAIAAANGGTGQTSYTIGDILYASGASALSKLAGVATGNALISGGVGTAPSWGKVALTTHVSGTLPVGNGGTGITSYTTGNYINASGTSTLQQRTPAQVRTDLGVTTCSEGTYTPTLTNVLNVTSSSAKVCQYTRVGNTVTVSGQVDVTPTAGAASTTVGISLPVASALTSSEQCAGSACEGGSGQYAPGAILADAANDRASLVFKSVGAGAAHAMLFTFTYRVL
jgi:hypothetical protein